MCPTPPVVLTSTRMAVPNSSSIQGPSHETQRCIRTEGYRCGLLTRQHRREVPAQLPDQLAICRTEVAHDPPPSLTRPPSAVIVCSTHPPGRARALVTTTSGPVFIRSRAAHTPADRPATGYAGTSTTAVSSLGSQVSPYNTQCIQASIHASIHASIDRTLTARGQMVRSSSAGLMLTLRWKKLSGSYSALIRASRASLSLP